MKSKKAVDVFVKAKINVTLSTLYNSLALGIRESAPLMPIFHHWSVSLTITVDILNIFSSEIQVFQ